MDVLWPEFAPQAAANRLRYALHMARQILEPASPPPFRYLSQQHGCVMLCPSAPIWIDVEAFEAALATARCSHDPTGYQAALDLYAGDLLPDDRYEDWAADRREELSARYLALLMELARLYEDRGEPQPAIETHQRVLAREPTHEAAHVSLMRLYALASQRHAALQQYRQLQQALRRELEVEPAPESQRLHQAILAGRYPAETPAGRPPTVALAPQGPVPSGPTPAGPRAHRGAPVSPTNLPVQTTSFVGRAQEIAQLRGLLARTRLLTLTGSGGCGKTRLALEVATTLLGDYPDGVWLAELAALSEPSLLPQAVASVFDLRERLGSSLLETLISYLRPNHLLLVLDNCEHLVPACASLADALLRTCPGLTILATSRQALRIAGEIAWRVPSLPVPAEDRAVSAADDSVAVLARFDAVRLFVDRAVAVQPCFALTRHNARHVAEVCRRLDGIPLAIELAAARVHVITVEQIAERLSDRFRLLATGSRAVLPRHQTLRALVDWSYDLLSKQERGLWRRLAAFAGTFELEAAEAVCSGDGIDASDVLELLAALVDKSLVLVGEDSGRARYRLLETIRQYGLERLRGAGEELAVRARHRDWYLAFAERAEPELWGPEQVAWLRRLDREHDNLRAAIEWCLRHDPTAAVRIAASIWRYWDTRGLFVEGSRWLAAALAAAPERTAARGKALRGAGHLAGNYDGDHARAEPLWQESLAIFQELDDRQGTGMALESLAFAIQSRGDPARARELWEQSLTLLREAGDKLGTAMTLGNLGHQALMQGDYSQTRRLYEECLELYRAIGHRWGVAWVMAHLGEVAQFEGDQRRAAPLLEESLALSREIGRKPAVAWVLLRLGEVAEAQGERERARSLLDESLALYREIGGKDGIERARSGLEKLAHATGGP